MFLSGKFQISTVQDPHAVFRSAISQLVNEQLFVRQKAETKVVFLERIQEAVGAEGRLLVAIFPTLERLLINGPLQQDRAKEECHDVQGTEAVQRFQFLFCKLFRVISTVCPVVFFWMTSSGVTRLVSTRYMLCCNHAITKRITRIQDF